MRFSVKFLDIIIHNEKKYTANIPYAPSKKRENLAKRIRKGILAGIHYTFYIGTYNHKKYNTQAFYPTTLECYLGIITGLIIYALCIALFLVLKYKFGEVGALVLLVPIITNLASLRK